jgi:hypothetical protein
MSAPLITATALARVVEPNRPRFREDRTAMVKIVSDNGEELATATLRKGSDDLTLAVERVVHGKGRLFSYYFSQGRRSVMIESGDFRLNGTIVTQWAGAERLWQVRLIHPAELRQAADTARFQDDKSRTAS